MRFYSASFFCDRGKGPVAELRVNNKDKDSDYPITLLLKSPETRLRPDVTFYITEVDFVRFKNSVLHQYNEYVRLCRATEWVVPVTFVHDLSDQEVISA